MKRIFYNWINRWNERLYGIVQQVRKGDSKQDGENGSFGCFFCNAELLFFNRLFHSQRSACKSNGYSFKNRHVLLFSLHRLLLSLVPRFVSSRTVDCLIPEDV